MIKRQIEIYYDIDNNRLCDSTANPISENQIPWIRYKENPLLLLHLIHSDASVYTGLDGTVAFGASIDNNYSHSDNLMIETTNDGINVPGDWASVDVTQGRISVRLDAFTAETLTKLGSVELLTNTVFELLGEVDDGGPVLVFSVAFPFYVRNLINAGAETPPDPVSSYYTKLETDALLLNKQPAASALNAFTALNPGHGDILVWVSAATAWSALGIGPSGAVLASDGALPYWSGP